MGAEADDRRQRHRGLRDAGLRRGTGRHGRRGRRGGGRGGRAGGGRACLPPGLRQGPRGAESREDHEEPRRVAGAGRHDAERPVQGAARGEDGAARRRAGGAAGGAGAELERPGARGAEERHEPGARPGAAPAGDARVEAARHR